MGRQPPLDAVHEFQADRAAGLPTPVAFMEARTQADEGNIAGSAQTILKALDQERRAGSVGPQVMQLIKPRPTASNWGNRS